LRRVGDYVQRESRCQQGDAEDLGKIGACSRSFGRDWRMPSRRRRS
jgi:hypothetical protein